MYTTMKPLPPAVWGVMSPYLNTPKGGETQKVLLC
jgi:hypothetical protein